MSCRVGPLLVVVSLLCLWTLERNGVRCFSIVRRREMCLPYEYLVRCTVIVSSTTLRVCTKIYSNGRRWYMVVFMVKCYSDSYHKRLCSWATLATASWTHSIRSTYTSPSLRTGVLTLLSMPSLVYALYTSRDPSGDASSPYDWHLSTRTWVTTCVWLRHTT